MPLNLSDLCELGGLLVVAVAVGMLAGLWWGVLTAGVLFVAACELLGDG